MGRDKHSGGPARGSKYSKNDMASFTPAEIMKLDSDEFIRTHSRTNQKTKPPRKAPPKKAPPKDPEFKNLNTISAQPMTEKQFYKHYK